MKRSILINCLLLVTAVGLNGQENAFPKLVGPYLGQKPPGLVPELFAPGAMAVAPHSAVVFSPDGSEAYFVPWSTLKMNVMKQINGIWTSPGIVPFASKHDAENPWLTPDGKRMYFTSTRAMDTDGPGRKGKFWRENLWYVERSKKGWSHPVPLDSAVNSFDLHWQFSFQDNSGDLYFSASSDEMGGGSDIYKSAYVNGSFHAPAKLGGVVNTNGDEDTPFIASDGSYLIFARKPGANTIADLYISFRNADGLWTEAKNMGTGVNSSAHEVCPIVTRDRKYLFFVSMRSGKPRAYWVSAQIIEELRPKE